MVNAIVKLEKLFVSALLDKHAFPQHNNLVGLLDC